MQNHFFTTRKHSEAERLLSIVAKGNGGKRAFSLKEIPGTHPSFGICFNGEPAAVAGKLSQFASFLRGYLAAEAKAKATDALYRKLRREHRRG